MGETKEFCSNCGQEVTSSDDFCPNCGFDLKKYRADLQKENEKPLETKAPQAKPIAAKPLENKPAESEDIKPEADTGSSDNAEPVKEVKKVPEPVKQVEHATVQNDTKTAKPKKKSHKLLGLIIVVILLIAAYFGGSWYFSESRQIQTLSDNLTSGMTSKMTQAAVDKDGDSFSQAQLKPLANLLIKDSNATSEIKSAINGSHSYSNFQLVQTGKYLGLYPKYKVALAKQHIEIDTNVTNPIFEIGGKKVAAINSGDEYQLPKSISGMYTVTVKAGSGASKKTKTVLIPISGNSSEYTINIAKHQSSTKSDDDEDEDTNSNNDDESSNNESDSDSDSNDSASADDLIGSWTNDTSTVTFNDDGTYSLEGKHGTYKVTSQSGDQISIDFHEDGSEGAPGWSATYTMKDDELELNSNHMTWDKD